ncbi:sulfotransferase family protein [Candidatus Poriferisocius sp.]|uniref:sulfotransferase family protein n=1 Tax=Candidatus Poriferisocius sp. TaxID=3101276 RepID=UPI003B5A7B27
MSWTPDPRPDWVAAVNRGDAGPVVDEARRPFDPHLLMAEALVRQGRAPDDRAALGADGFVEPLTLFCHGLEHEADLTVMGRWMSRRMILRLLEVRIQINDYLAADPGTLDEPVDQPIFVIGAPRTGTTVMHGVLAQDPAHRAPEGWELLRPVPPPDPDPDIRAADPRIALAGAELVMPQTVASGMLAIHEYSGRMFKECLSAMSFEFRSEEMVSRTDMPTYQAWYDTADLRPAYRTYRRVLQILQRRMPTRRWVLKSPAHLQGLPALMDVFDDARFVITHRDPTAILPSVTSLIATMRWAHSDRVDFAAIGRYHLELYARSLDNLIDLIDSGRLPADRTAQVPHRQVSTEKLAAARSVYEQLGMELSADAEAAMAAYADATPPGKHGEHRYEFEDLGLTRTEVRARFARYIDRFDIPVAANE